MSKNKCEFLYCWSIAFNYNGYLNSKVHGTYMGPTLGRQGLGGSHVGPMILAIWVYFWQLMTLGLQA